MGLRLLAPMRLFAAIFVLSATPAAAMVGKTFAPPATFARHVVMFTGSGGTFCTGTVIARDLVLTAGHCIDPRDRYKLIQFSGGGQPVLLDITNATRHPQFDIKAFLNHRATADVAVLKLAQSLPASYAPAPLASAEKKIVVGNQLTVVGYGVSARGNGKTGGTLRATTLTVTGQPGSLQIRLVDPASNNTAPGMGACTGDSGAPAFDPSGAIIGVVSWSTAPENEDGCGGLTGITPLIRYQAWLYEIARQIGSPLR